MHVCACVCVCVFSSYWIQVFSNQSQTWVCAEFVLYNVSQISFCNFMHIMGPEMGGGGGGGVATLAEKCIWPIISSFLLFPFCFLLFLFSLCFGNKSLHRTSSTGSDFVVIAQCTKTKRCGFKCLDAVVHTFRAVDQHLVCLQVRVRGRCSDGIADTVHYLLWLLHENQDKQGTIFCQRWMICPVQHNLNCYFATSEVQHTVIITSCQIIEQPPS